MLHPFEYAKSDKVAPLDGTDNEQEGTLHKKQNTQGINCEKSGAATSALDSMLNVNVNQTLSITPNHLQHSINNTVAGNEKDHVGLSEYETIPLS